MVSKLSNLSFETFTKETDEKVRNFGTSLKGSIVFSEITTWVKIDEHINKFNLEGRNWNVELIGTEQNDFFILRFFHLKESLEERYFFVKSIAEQTYVTLLIFTFSDSDGYRVFSSFVQKIWGMWFAWVGSKFLENFEDFLLKKFNVSSTIFVQFSLEFRDSHSKKREGGSLNWMTKSTEYIRNFRKFHYSQCKEIVYIKRGKYQFNFNDSLSLFSLTDRAEFTIYKGGFFELFPLIKEILEYSKYLRDIFRRKIITKKTQRKDDKNNIVSDIISVDSIEVLQIDVKDPTNENWFQNLIEAFSVGFISEHKIMSFVLKTGNPYFLTNLIDTENGLRVFLSVVGDSIRISPSQEPTKPSTISKISSILQSRVDPSLYFGVA